MTNDEAIEIIECGDISNRWGKDGKEVEKMAIKALKQQPCDDCISRKAVLDVLKGKWNMFSDANDAMQESIDTIESLQPVSSSEKPNKSEIPPAGSEARARWICCPMCDKKKCEREADDCDVKIYLRDKAEGGE